MSSEFVHYPVGEEIKAAAGSYTLQKEAVISIAGRDVLYLLAFASVDSSCCGVGGVGYAVVPGFIVKLKDHLNEEGLPVSIVEPISDSTVREKTAKMIKEAESIEQVNFLT